MATLQDGSTVTIHRDGSSYTVEHRNAAGTLIDSMEGCSFEEARAAMEIGPSRW